MTLKRLSAVALAISTALTLTACGSEADTARGLANAPNPLVQPSNTGNSNTNTSNADAADAIDNTDAGTNTGTTTNPTAPNTTGNSGSTSGINTPVTNTGSLTIASELDFTVEVNGQSHALLPSQTRDSLIYELRNSHKELDAYNNSRIQAISSYKADLNGTKRDMGMAFSFPHIGIGEGYHDLPLTETAKFSIDGTQYEGTRNSRVKLYQGENSMVLGVQTLSGEFSNGSEKIVIPQGDIHINILKGTPTSNDDIQLVAGHNTFSYKGKAFSQAGSGDFEYTIDFLDDSGYGKITGLSDKGTINLNQAGMGNITHKNSAGDQNPVVTRGIQGLAHFENGAKEGVYTLGIFGPNATEVAGFVTEDGDKHTVGFGGKKQ